MASRKHEPDMSNEAALLEVESAGSMTIPELKTPEHFAKDCDWQAAWEDAYALRCAARGDFERAQAASARAARWRVNAQAWRGTEKVAGDRQYEV
jgi:hypothetical protein